ncbi:MAG: single-stranded DNA-binding protein [Desulfobacteraceae bacterium]|nr:single-stranded DNA-binding protein [Desulfobacteraceae bacterium]
MAGINKVIIIGRLGRDPEMRYTPDGTAVATFSVATSDEWRDKATGEKKERTEWHRIVAWRRLGEICGEYLSKGRQVYVEGKLQTRSWEQDGVTRYMTEIVASDVQFMGNRDDAGTSAAQRPAGRPANQGSGSQQNQGQGYQSSQGSGSQQNQGQGYQSSQGSDYQQNQGQGYQSSQGSNQSPSQRVADQGYPEPPLPDTQDDDIPF